LQKKVFGYTTFHLAEKKNSSRVYDPFSIKLFFPSLAKKKLTASDLMFPNTFRDFKKTPASGTPYVSQYFLETFKKLTASKNRRCKT